MLSDCLLVLMRLTACYIPVVSNHMCVPGLTGAECRCTTWYGCIASDTEGCRYPHHITPCSPKLLEIAFSHPARAGPAAPRAATLQYHLVPTASNWTVQSNTDNARRLLATQAHNWCHHVVVQLDALLLLYQAVARLAALAPLPCKALHCHASDNTTAPRMLVFCACKCLTKERCTQLVYFIV